MKFINKIPKEKFEANHNFLIVDMLDEKEKTSNEEITSAGIVLTTPKIDPMQMTPNLSFARVVSAGDLCKSTKIGDIVGFMKLAANVIAFDMDNRLYVINENDAMVKIIDE